MKNLKCYIKESLLDDEEDLVNDDTELEIKEFLKENYNTKNCTYTIKNSVVNVNGLISVKNRSITSLTNDLFEFGEVGVFQCNDCKQLTSLKGSPRKVKGDFNCTGTGIKDLTGAPEEVGELFNCEDCEQLTSLEGSPRKVKHYSCNSANIKDLTGITQQIEDTLDCSYCEKLESLKGAPKKIPGCLLLDGCENLKSLKYCPKEIGGYLRFPGVLDEEFIKEEIKKYNIKIKQASSETGRTIHF